MSTIVNLEEVETVTYRDNQVDEIYWHDTKIWPAIPTSISFAEDSWDTINYYAERGLANTKYHVDDEKIITLDGGEQITLQILGFNHDDLADGTGKANVTIGMKDLLANTYQINTNITTNKGGWGGYDTETEQVCAMRVSVMPEYYNKLPLDLKSIIKTVYKETMAGSLSTVIKISSDNLFLFSWKELSDTRDEGYIGEGMQYEYWRRHNTDTERIKKLPNEAFVANWWWLRSPSTFNSNNFVAISNTGGYGYDQVLALNGVCFGFCIGKHPSTFATDSWATIAGYAENGTARDHYFIGDEKTIILDGGEPVTLQILGFNHDDLADETGKAGITLGMKDILTTEYPMNEKDENNNDTNAGGWHTCLMRTSTMSEYYGKLPPDLKSVIKTVVKKTTAGNQSTEIKFSSDNLFLFSRKEITNAETEGYKEEGTQYEYWLTHNTEADRIKQRFVDGVWHEDMWWFRTPGLYDTNTFGGSNMSGYTNYSEASTLNGVCFGFCI